VIAATRTAEKTRTVGRVPPGMRDARRRRARRTTRQRERKADDDGHKESGEGTAASADGLSTQTLGDRQSRQRQAETERNRQKQTRQTDRDGQRDRRTDRRTDGQTDSWTDRQLDRLTGRPTGRLADQLADNWPTGRDKQTDRHHETRVLPWILQRRKRSGEAVVGSRGGHGERLERALVMVVEILQVVVVMVEEVVLVVVLSFYRRSRVEVLGFWRHLNNGSESSCVCTDGRRTSQLDPTANSLLYDRGTTAQGRNEQKIPGRKTPPQKIK